MNNRVVRVYERIPKGTNLSGIEILVEHRPNLTVKQKIVRQRLRNISLSERIFPT